MEKANFNDIIIVEWGQFEDEVRQMQGGKNTKNRLVVNLIAHICGSI